MKLSRLATWLWTGHQHAVVSTGLAPAVDGDAWRPQLVEVERCDCGAVRPIDGRWVKPLGDR